MSVGEFLYKIAIKSPERLYNIVPACEGTETPIKREDRYYLYVFDVTKHDHYYIGQDGRRYENPFSN